jgi:hypothetical protein
MAAADLFADIVGRALAHHAVGIRTVAPAGAQWDLADAMGAFTNAETTAATIPTKQSSPISTYVTWWEALSIRDAVRLRLVAEGRLLPPR